MAKINDSIFRYDRDFVERFNRACDDIIQSKYILAEGKISVLLQTIAANKYLYEFFKNAVDGFDFSHEYRRSQISDGKRYTLTLPQNPIRLIAYVFCLLLEFDSRRLSVKDFLHEFFYSELGANVEYERFVIDVVVPFKHNVNKLLSDTDEETDDPNPADELFAELSAVLTSLTGAHDELAFLMAALKKAVDTDDKLLAQTAFIGGKNTAKADGLLESMAPILEKLRVFLISTGFLR